MVIDCEFKPLADITAFELSEIVRRCRMPSVTVRFSEKKWAELDPGVKRHFHPISGFEEDDGYGGTFK